MSVENLYQLESRSNIFHKRAGEKEVIIYEDHRTILNVLFHFIYSNKITEPVDLVMFDNHDDFCLPSPKALSKITNFLKKPTKEKLHQIVEFDLNPLDDDWVKAGMELGLIGNCFLFNSAESSIRDNEEYKTKKFGTKGFYNMGNVWSAIGHKGKLNDPIVRRESLWNDFGWEFFEGKFRFKQDRRKFIFDFDLDCFSMQILDKTVAIPEEIIVQKFSEFQRSSYHYYQNSQEFVKDLISKSEFVTMCFENDYCGGIRECQKIFNTIDSLFFNRELGE